MERPRVIERLAVLALIGVAPMSAAAAPPRPQGRPTTVGGQLFGRPGDNAETQFWRDRPADADTARLMPLPPPTPPARGGLPELHSSPLPPTRNGPVTMEDLHLRRNADGSLIGKRPGFHFSVARDGRIAFQDRGGFDLTDFLMRLNGQDPYVYDKHLVMRMTEPMRITMTDEDRRHTMAAALAELPGRLGVLWAMRTPAEERRALLFLLWDECLEPDSQPDGPAGARARALIEDFVRVQLPASSAEAYPAAELARLNTGRRSRAPFTPYPRSP